MSTYASPESLVETSWLAEHLNDADIRIVESNEDISSTVPATFRTPFISIGARI